MMALLDERNQPAKAGRRTSRSRTTRTLSVILMLVFTTIAGPVAFAADISDPTPTFEGLSPAERQLLEESLANTESGKYPYAETGYPGELPAIAPAAPRDAVAASADALGSWSNEQLCLGGEQCLIGDFNGDKRDDVAVLYRDTRPEPERGDVKVALSGGSYFSPSSRWLDGVCTGNHLCKAGDANNDGKDDLIIFHRGWGESGTGNVDVAISTGSSFATPALWHDYFCIGDQVCDVGNFDGYNGDDLILFARGAPDDDLAGDVLVARSNGSNRFGSVESWADFFCINQEECRVGDFDGDNRDDIAFFVKSGDGQGRLGVSRSTGSQFSYLGEWWSWFCINNEQCEIGDFDGDRRDDLLALLRGSEIDPSKYGNAYVKLATGGSFMDSQLWSDLLCVPGEDCGVGDFNGDGRADVIRFVKQSADASRVGLVLVALAAGSPTGFFPTPAPGGLWQSSFCTGTQTCLTGDFNGDGRDDVAYLIRSTQLGAVEGDVYVALSDGIQFGTPTRWHDYFCVGSDVCKVGDFNADGRDDLVAFSRATASYGNVFVTLSGSSSGADRFMDTQVWAGYFCVGSEVCEIGDFNGDNRDDIALFTRSAYSGDRAGDVEVALSSGDLTSGLFNPTNYLWHNFFCIGNESCQTGDFNGDGLDDIVTFTKGDDANVYVELSNGSSFGDANAPAEKWHDLFCALNEACDVGDFDGNGRDDIVTFLQSDYVGGIEPHPETNGDVIVAVSAGSQWAGGFITLPKWIHYFCIGNEICETGDFNGDGVTDIAAFTRGTYGYVYVALARIGTGYYFADAPGTPPVSKWLLPLFIRRTGQ